MQIKALRGTQDLLSPVVEKWRSVETLARDVFRLYHFKELRTPILEETALFTRALGETAEVVAKQMYSFTDRGERKISLRPEGTAPAIRAYLEHHLDQNQSLVRLFYIGAMFRAERPQAGRSRQFHQIGAEAIGSHAPAVDAEGLSLIALFFERAGLKEYTLHVNSLGCADDKKEIGVFLQSALEKKKEELCAECQERLSRNVFRILDCKKENCRRVVQALPPISEKLCRDCLDHFEAVKRLLSFFQIAFVISPHLVRGLDYYTRTTFEVTHPLLGAQDAIGAGGRYDGLVSELGGKPTGAFGFSIGFERLMLALEAQQPAGETIAGDTLDVYVVTIGEKLFEEGRKLLQFLRRSGFSAVLDFEKRSLKAQMREANHLKARWVVLLGEDELKENKVTLKEMENGKEEKVDREKLIDVLRARRGEKKG